MADHDISKMKVADLKKELKNRGLSTLGNKNELIDRLQSALIDGGDPLEDTANSEDLLEDDELNDDILEEDEEKLQDGTAEEEHILKSPTPSETSKVESPVQEKSELDKIQRQEKKDDQSTVLQKKVSLKRNISISVPTSVVPSVTSGNNNGKASESDKGVGENNGESKSNEPEKKVIKLSQMSAQERLEMRAKKFGPQAAETSDTKLQARAARFGIGGSNPSSSTNASNLVSLDALKKRAERFGSNVSDKLTKVEQEEKLLKRQERFGDSVASSKLTATGKIAITASGTDSSVKTDYAERARLRLERFKNTA
ncbi:uncharacterized protein LOC129777445 [Toxorhynchites rutilus septentrionalis]|uniref:uncharacterized protein LOC129777445 n=1 Tax=Toxorhynchites rutilus septentrionalis TaxID=329112 RepID=UPI00247873AF|nr:uncharacterized protein LOC129777445 [Toxorhynchites rutilus septentrionalis]